MFRFQSATRHLTPPLDFIRPAPLSTLQGLDLLWQRNNYWSCLSHLTGGTASCRPPLRPHRLFDFLIVGVLYGPIRRPEFLRCLLRYKPLSHLVLPPSYPFSLFLLFPSLPLLSFLDSVRAETGFVDHLSWSTFGGPRFAVLFLKGPNPPLFPSSFDFSFRSIRFGG